MGLETVSVVIRAKDEAACIGRTLELLAAQTRPPDEVIVVDSGSADETPQIAVDHGARLIEIPAESFTFGGSLNTGCAAASGDLLVALSAHAYPSRPGWLAYLVDLMQDERIACASGSEKNPHFVPLRERILQDARLARDFPVFGYSNSAGGFRADLWRRRPFREDMPATEDKEWALYWLDRGYVAAIDPELLVDHDHSEDSLSEQFRRARIEQIGFGMFMTNKPKTLRDFAQSWWEGSEVYENPWQARFSPRRFARAVGRAVADRQIGHGAAAERPAGLRLALMTDRYPVVSETFVVNEVEELRRQGHDVRVGATSRPEPGGEYPGHAAIYLDEDTRWEKLAGLAGLILRNPSGAARDVASRRRWQKEEPARRLRGLAARAARLRRAGVCHIHVHFAAEAALDAMRIASLLKIPYSLTAHAYDIFETPMNLREKIERAAFTTTGCEYNRRYLQRLVDPGAAERIHVMVMGVDPEAFRRRTPYPGGRHVMAVGRLVEKKGFSYLVEAIAELEEEAPVDRLTIAGEGPLRAELKDAVRQLGLEERVSMPGAMSPIEVREALESADVLVMPAIVASNGDRDSMPVVVKEAMAMEIPVIATDEVGLPELVDEQVGRLVPPRDSKALAATIAEVLALPSEERQELGRAGRRRAIELCDLRRETERLAQWIRSVQSVSPAETASRQPRGGSGTGRGVSGSAAPL